MEHRYAVISTAGALLSSFSGDPCYFAEEIGHNLLIPLEDDIMPDDSVIHVYDFQRKKLSTLKKVPHHTFNYETRQWIDNRTLDEIKAQKWDQLKQQRNALEFDGFLFEGLLYDSDQVSQGRILGAMLSGQDQTWTTKDNIVVTLTATQLQELYVALQTHVAVAHERGRIARTALDSATTPEEIEAIQI